MNDIGLQPKRIRHSRPEAQWVRALRPFFLALGLFSFGCADQNEKPDVPTFAFVTNNTSNFWTIARKGTEDAAREFGIQIEFQQPPTGTIAEQRRIVEDLLNKGIDGMSISPIDPVNQSEFLVTVSQEIPLLCHDSDAPDSGRLAYIGTHNYHAGRKAGELIKEALPQGGGIMLFVGTLDAQNAQDRKRGIEDEVEGSGIEIVDTRTDGVDPIRARANAEDALVSHPDLNCLVGLWSYNGPALAAAVRDAGRQDQVKIVCFDEDEATLQAIQDGFVHATVVQKPYQMGYQAMRLLAEIHQNAEGVVPESGIIDTGVEIVRQENLDEFRAELRRLTES